MAIPYEQRVGEKINKLKILELIGKRHNGHRVKIMCLVECECGTKFETLIESVVSGQTTSCGCNRKKHGNSAQRKMYNNYKNGAKSRGYSFELTQEEFVFISSSYCHYCGAEPSNVKEMYGDTFVINGIDRMDNTIGYTIGNSLPCCSICNRAKGILSYDDFLGWIEAIKEWQS